MSLDTTIGGANADAYVTVAAFKTWAASRGYDLEALDADDTEDVEPAIRRGTSYIDFTYEDRFPGMRTGLRDQALAWPRTGACDAVGNAIASDEIPVEVINASYEAAWREVNTPDVLLPDIEPGGGVIKRVRADTVEVEYASNGQTTKTFPAIGAALAPLIGKPSMYTAMAVRA